MDISNDGDKTIANFILGSRALNHLLTRPISSQCSLISMNNDENLLDKLSKLVKCPNSTNSTWNIAIFWNIAAAQSGDFVLGWGEGTCREPNQAEINEFMPKFVYGIEDNTQQHMREKVLTMLCRLFGRTDEDNYVTGLGSVTETELYFLASMYFSFPIGEGGPGRCFQSEKHEWNIIGSKRSDYCVRTHMARCAGIQTVVFIPIGFGVIELVSMRSMPENSDLVHFIRSTFTVKNNEAKQVSRTVHNKLHLNFTEPASSRPSMVSGLESEHSEILLPSPRKRGCNSPKRAVNHVEAERQRREKLNRRLCAIRAIVPNITKLDKASVLEDTIRYIKELQQKVQKLETKNPGIGIRDMEIDIQTRGNEVVIVNVRYPMNTRPLSGVVSAFEEANVTILESRLAVRNDKVSHTFIVNPRGSEEVLREKLDGILTGEF